MVWHDVYALGKILFASSTLVAAANGMQLLLLRLLYVGEWYSEILGSNYF